MRCCFSRLFDLALAVKEAGDRQVVKEMVPVLKWLQAAMQTVQMLKKSHHLAGTRSRICLLHLCGGLNGTTMFRVYPAMYPSSSASTLPIVVTL